MTKKLPSSLAGATAMGAAAIGSAAIAAALLYVNHRKEKKPTSHETPSGEPPQTD